MSSHQLRFFDPVTKTRLLSPSETEAARLAAEAGASAAETRATEEVAARLAAKEEVAVCARS